MTEPPIDTLSVSPNSLLVSQARSLARANSGGSFRGAQAPTNAVDLLIFRAA